MQASKARGGERERIGDSFNGFVAGAAEKKEGVASPLFPSAVKYVSNNRDSRKLFLPHLPLLTTVVCVCVCVCRLGSLQHGGGGRRGGGRLLLRLEESSLSSEAACSFLWEGERS